jgi:hypothetical protein
MYGRLVIFSRFGMFEPRKIWQPWNQLVEAGKGANFTTTA